MSSLPLSSECGSTVQNFQNPEYNEEKICVIPIPGSEDDAKEMLEQLTLTDVSQAKSIPDHISKTDEKRQEESKNKTVCEEKPTLSKFFAEERIGTDVEGCAFFEKIALKESDNLPKTGNQVDLPTPINVMAKPTILMAKEDNKLGQVWIPSTRTQQILATRQGIMENLTKPKLAIEEEQKDPLKLLLMQVNSAVAHERKTLTADDVPQNIDGLETLINAGSFHAALNLTTRLLRASRSSPDQIGLERHTPQSMQLWFSRIALFVKLKKFSFAEVESEAFGNLDHPDMHYEFYADDKDSSHIDQSSDLKSEKDVFTCGKATIVPFSFRLLLAELPQYQGNYQLTSNNLYQILHIIEKLIEDHLARCPVDGCTNSTHKEFLDLWKQREYRVLYSILNCALSQKDYVMAISVANILLKKDVAHNIEILSIIGRIYLQLGDLSQAQVYFNLSNTHSKFVKTQESDVQQLINKALLAMCYSNNEEAYNLYNKASLLDPNNVMVINNMAVCLLYMGRLKESVLLLEQTIQKNPELCLHDGVIFNICTLYELESSHSTSKKHAMLNLVSKFATDRFSPSSLKI